MTELEQRLLDLLEQERQEREKERQELYAMLNAQSELLHKVIEELRNLGKALQEEEKEQENFETSLKELENLLKQLNE